MDREGLLMVLMVVGVVVFAGGLVALMYAAQALTRLITRGRKK